MLWPRKVGRGPRGHSGWTSPETLDSGGQEEMWVTFFSNKTCVPLSTNAQKGQQNIYLIQNKFSFTYRLVLYKLNSCPSTEGLVLQLFNIVEYCLLLFKWPLKTCVVSIHFILISLEMRICA